jgi:hypothetical protein
MEKENIELNVANVPYSILGEVQADGEIWEAQDGGAFVKVTRHILATLNQDAILSLTVSGPTDERQRVINEFVEVYGPTALPVDAESHMDTAIWLYPPIN